jgi:hypothetical protein
MLTLKPRFSELKDVKSKQPRTFLGSVIKIQKWYRKILSRRISAKRKTINFLTGYIPAPAIITGYNNDSFINKSNRIMNQDTADSDEFVNTRISRIISYLKTVEDDTKSCIEDDTKQNSVFETLKSKISSLRTQLVQKDEQLNLVKSQLSAIKENASESNSKL